MATCVQCGEDAGQNQFCSRTCSASFVAQRDAGLKPKQRIRYREASAYTGIPEGTLRALVSRKKIPHIRIGPRTVLFDTEALDQWLKDQTFTPGESK